MSRYKNNQLETLNTAYIDEHSKHDCGRTRRQGFVKRMKKVETKINRNAFRNSDIALGAVAQINMKWQYGKKGNLKLVLCFQLRSNGLDMDDDDSVCDSKQTEWVLRKMCENKKNTKRHWEAVLSRIIFMIWWKEVAISSLAPSSHCMHSHIEI